MQASARVAIVRPSYVEYAAVTAVLVAGCLAIARITSGPSVPIEPRALVKPVVALVALTGAVLALTASVRNVAVFLGRASVQYYADYATNVPDEKLERPARTFNNLMQVPNLFYVLCVFMIVTGVADSTQLGLAWLFVATRFAHAVVYMGWNRVSIRFAMYAAGCITLGVMWTRFALRV